MEKGFTLIELTCCMVIIAILAMLTLTAVDKTFRGNSFKRVRALFTLTKEMSTSDNLDSVDLEKYLEKPETNLPMANTNLPKASDYWAVKTEKSKDSIVFTFTMKKPFNSFRSFQTVSQNVVRIEFPK